MMELTKDEKRYLNRIKRMPVEDRYTHWVRERDDIRRKKDEDCEKPWTDDPILRRFRFCNVRRMDDKVSKWLNDNWYTPHYDDERMVIACVLARHFNNPEALAAIQDELFESVDIRVGLRKSKRILIDRAKKGKKNFNGAYIIRASPDYPNKVSMVFDETVKPFLTVPIGDFTEVSLISTCVELLQSFRNIGSFMAGQIAADLRHAAKVQYKDLKTWAPIGPGSRRGMNRYLERTVTAPMNQEEFTERLLEVMKRHSHQFPRISRRLEAQDWQNTFCEFDKYERVLHGEGKPKQKYKGEV